MNSKLKWLEFSEYDLKSGLGGAEVHARSLVRELEVLGVDVQISAESLRLAHETWDVVHTHGSSPIPLLSIFSPSRKFKWMHTLHGTSIGRMKACSEWFWIGGYLAYLKEIYATLFCDVLVAVHEDLHLVKWARKTGKQVLICENGYDAASTSMNAMAQLDPALRGKLREKRSVGKKVAAFIGRSEDYVKGYDRFVNLMHASPELVLVSAPGVSDPSGLIQSTGVLTSFQVSQLLMEIDALVIPSRYEGLPLVALEALALGVKVVAMQVGGLKELLKGQPSEKTGYYRVQNSSELGSVLKRALNASDGMDPKTRAETLARRGLYNQKFLKTWNQVARSILPDSPISDRD